MLAFASVLLVLASVSLVLVRALLQPSGKLNYSFAFECPAPTPPDFKVEPKIRVSAQIEMKKYFPNFEMWGCGGKSENALC